MSAKSKENFSEEYIKKNRTFPRLNLVLLAVCIIAQIALIIFIIAYKKPPQDVINKYDITVEPCEDGTLDIYYYFEWTALDTEEDLTWIDIGVANNDWRYYPDSLSSNISRIEK